MTGLTATDKISYELTKSMVPRTKSILETSIEDFIETARPVTSGYLYKKYDFGIKPAMIRRELSKLDQAGFLSQIHPSGGRIPTNKAYRLFVKNLKEENLEPDVPKKTGREMLEELASQKMNVLTEMLAEYLDTLSAVYEPTRQEFFSAGLKNLFESVETEEKNELGRIIKDFEMLPHRLSQKIDNLSGRKEIQVFVGNNPLTESEYLSVMAEEFNQDGDRFLILTIGPRRMDYRKSLCIFRFFENET